MRGSKKELAAVWNGSQSNPPLQFSSDLKNKEKSVGCKVNRVAAVLLKKSRSSIQVSVFDEVAAA